MYHLLQAIDLVENFEGKPKGQTTFFPREREVLSWVIGGALNKQIAAQLGIAEKTVKIHRGRVMEKMEASSVAELVSLCREVGIKPQTCAQRA